MSNSRRHHFDHDDHDAFSGEDDHDSASSQVHRSRAASSPMFDPNSASAFASGCSPSFMGAGAGGDHSAASAAAVTSAAFPQSSTSATTTTAMMDTRRRDGSLFAHPSLFTGGCGGATHHPHPSLHTPHPSTATASANTSFLGSASMVLGGGRVGLHGTTMGGSHNPSLVASSCHLAGAMLMTGGPSSSPGNNGHNTGGAGGVNNVHGNRRSIMSISPSGGGSFFLQPPPATTAASMDTLHASGGSRRGSSSSGNGSPTAATAAAAAAISTSALASGNAAGGGAPQVPSASAMNESFAYAAPMYLVGGVSEGGPSSQSFAHHHYPAGLVCGPGDAVEVLVTPDADELRRHFSQRSACSFLDVSTVYDNNSGCSVDASPLVLPILPVRRRKNKSKRNREADKEEEEDDDDNGTGRPVWLEDDILAVAYGTFDTRVGNNIDYIYPQEHHDSTGGSSGRRRRGEREVEDTEYGDDETVKIDSSSNQGDVAALDAVHIGAAVREWIAAWRLQDFCFPDGSHDSVLDTVPLVISTRGGSLSAIAAAHADAASQYVDRCRQEHQQQQQQQLQQHHSTSTNNNNNNNSTSTRSSSPHQPPLPPTAAAYSSFHHAGASRMASGSQSPDERSGGGGALDTDPVFHREHTAAPPPSTSATAAAGNPLSSESPQQQDTSSSSPQQQHPFGSPVFGFACYHLYKDATADRGAVQRAFLILTRRPMAHALKAVARQALVPFLVQVPATAVRAHRRFVRALYRSLRGAFGGDVIARSVPQLTRCIDRACRSADVAAAGANAETLTRANKRAAAMAAMAEEEEEQEQALGNNNATDAAEGKVKDSTDQSSAKGDIINSANDVAAVAAPDVPVPSGFSEASRALCFLRVLRLNFTWSPDSGEEGSAAITSSESDSGDDGPRSSSKKNRHKSSRKPVDANTTQQPQNQSRSLLVPSQATRPPDRHHASGGGGSGNVVGDAHVQQHGHHHGAHHQLRSSSDRRPPLRFELCLPLVLPRTDAPLVAQLAFGAPLKTLLSWFGPNAATIHYAMLCGLPVLFVGQHAHEVSLAVCASTHLLAPLSAHLDVRAFVPYATLDVMDRVIEAVNGNGPSMLPPGVSYVAVGATNVHIVHRDVPGMLKCNINDGTVAFPPPPTTRHLQQLQQRRRESCAFLLSAGSASAGGGGSVSLSPQGSVATSPFHSARALQSQPVSSMNAHMQHSLTTTDSTSSTTNTAADFHAATHSNSNNNHATDSAYGSPTSGGGDDLDPSDTAGAATATSTGTSRRVASPSVHYSLQSLVPRWAAAAWRARRHGDRSSSSSAAAGAAHHEARQQQQHLDDLAATTNHFSFHRDILFDNCLSAFTFQGSKGLQESRRHFKDELLPKLQDNHLRECFFRAWMLRYNLHLKRECFPLFHLVQSTCGASAVAPQLAAMYPQSALAHQGFVTASASSFAGSGGSIIGGGSANQNHHQLLSPFESNLKFLEYQIILASKDLSKEKEKEVLPSALLTNHAKAILKCTNNIFVQQHYQELFAEHCRRQSTMVALEAKKKASSAAAAVATGAGTDGLSSGIQSPLAAMSPGSASLQPPPPSFAPASVSHSYNSGDDLHNTARSTASPLQMQMHVDPAMCFGRSVPSGSPTPSPHNSSPILPSSPRSGSVNGVDPSTIAAVREQLGTQQKPPSAPSSDFVIVDSVTDCGPTNAAGGANAPNTATKSNAKSDGSMNSSQKKTLPPPSSTSAKSSTQQQQQQQQARRISHDLTAMSASTTNAPALRRASLFGGNHSTTSTTDAHNNSSNNSSTIVTLLTDTHHAGPFRGLPVATVIDELTKLLDEYQCLNSKNKFLLQGVDEWYQRIMRYLQNSIATESGPDYQRLGQELMAFCARDDSVSGADDSVEACPSRPVESCVYQQSVDREARLRLTLEYRERLFFFVDMLTRCNLRARVRKANLLMCDLFSGAVDDAQRFDLQGQILLFQAPCTFMTYAHRIKTKTTGTVYLTRNYILFLAGKMALRRRHQLIPFDLVKGVTQHTKGYLFESSSVRMLVDIAPFDKRMPMTNATATAAAPTSSSSSKMAAVAAAAAAANQQQQQQTAAPTRDSAGGGNPSNLRGKIAKRFVDDYTALVSITTDDHERLFDLLHALFMKQKRVVSLLSTIPPVHRIPQGGPVLTNHGKLPMLCPMYVPAGLYTLPGEVQYDEAWENQRAYPLVGWSSRLLVGDPSKISDFSCTRSMVLDNHVPSCAPGFEWIGEWQLACTLPESEPTTDRLLATNRGAHKVVRAPAEAPTAEHGYLYGFTAAWSSVDGFRTHACVGAVIRRRLWVRGRRLLSPPPPPPPPPQQSQSSTDQTATTAGNLRSSIMSGANSGSSSATTRTRSRFSTTTNRGVSFNNGGGGVGEGTTARTASDEDLQPYGPASPSSRAGSSMGGGTATPLVPRRRAARLSMYVADGRRNASGFYSAACVERDVSVSTDATDSVGEDDLAEAAMQVPVVVEDDDEQQ